MLEISKCPAEFVDVARRWGKAISAGSFRPDAWGRYFRPARERGEPGCTGYGLYVFTGACDPRLADPSLVPGSLARHRLRGRDRPGRRGDARRARPATIIFLSALGEESDRIAGLDVGASHYLPKPCSPREILATVRAALRHRDSADPAVSRTYLFAGWRIDFVSHELLDPEGVLVNLTDGEFAVLRAFIERPRRVLARDALLEAARGPDTPAFDRAIDVQVSRLRRKLRSAGDGMIRTVRNEGYLFTPLVTRG
jgi:DNA-binding response OmpR family regulator